MAPHLFYFTAKQGMSRRPALLPNLTLQDLRRYEPTWELYENGVKGAFLLDSNGQDIGAVNGTLLAILHARRGGLEWVPLSGDFRNAWCAMPDDVQAAMLEAERAGRMDDDLSNMVLAPELASQLSHVAHPYGGTAFKAISFAPLGEEMRPTLTEDKVAFLWVLNTYQDEHGKALQVLPQETLDSLPRFNQ